MRTKFFLGSLFLLAASMTISAQAKLSVNGNGLFVSPASTNVDIKNLNDNTNALIRFGDANILKASLGFNGNEDGFKISMGNTVGREDLTMAENGYNGLNALPTAHRFFIKHNSTSGISGSAHLTLEESSFSNFARLLSKNVGQNGSWTIGGRATEGSARMQFTYQNGVSTATEDILTLDGDHFRVGIHAPNPDAYLHIKQLSAGVDALAIVANGASGDKWSFRIGDNDILVYFNGGIRGGFNSDDGVYKNFAPQQTAGYPKARPAGRLLKDVLRLRPRILADDRGRTAGLLPQEIAQVNDHWLIRLPEERGWGISDQQFAVLAIGAIREQQALISARQEEIARLQARNSDRQARLEALEQLIAQLEKE